MASLLKEIRNAAIEADAPIANVLRKCAVLGSQLKNDDLRDWALQELNGYDNNDDVPEYRRVQATPEGSFAGPFGTGYKNVGVPVIGLPEQLRERAMNAVFAQGVAGLEALTADSKGGPARFSWPGDWITLINAKSSWAGGMTLYAAWQDVDKASIAEMLDAIRNRVLEFCICLEREMPELLSDDDDQQLPTDVEAVAGQVFNQVIVFGSHIGNIANASPGAEQVVRDVKGNDLTGLVDALTEIGVPLDEVETLRVAVEEEVAGAGKTADPCGRWYKRAKQAVASGAWKLVQGATISTIRGAIMSYLGLA